MADITLEEIQGLDDDGMVQLPSGRLLSKKAATKLASTLGTGWIDKVDANDKLFETKINPAVGMAAQAGLMALPGGELANLGKLAGEAPTLINILKGAGNIAGAGLNMYSAAKSPEAGLGGYSGSRLAEMLARKVGLGPTATGAAIGLGGAAGMLGGDELAGGPSSPSSEDWIKNTLIGSAVGAAPAAVGSSAKRIQELSRQPEALRSFERAVGREPGTLFGKKGVSLAKSAEAPLVSSGAADTLAAQLPVQEVVSKTSALKQQAVENKMAMNSARRAELEAQMNLNEASQSSDSRVREQARQALTQATKSVNDIKLQQATAKDAYLKQRQDLVEQYGAGTSRELKIALKDLDSVYRMDTAERGVSLTQAQNELSQSRVEKKPQTGVKIDLPENNELRRVRGLRYGLELEQLKKESESLAVDALASPKASNAFSGFNEKQRKLVKTLATTPSGSLGTSLVNAGADGYDVAVAMAPEHARAFSDAVVNEVVGRSLSGGSMRVDPDKFLQQVKENREVLSRAFPDVAQPELMKKFEEASQVLAALPKGAGEKTLQYLKNRGLWYLVEGATLSMSPVAGAAVVAADKILITTDKLVRTLVENDKVRDSALRWASDGKTGRLTGDAGRAWFAYLNAHPEDRPTVDLMKERYDTWKASREEPSREIPNVQVRP